MIAGRRQHVVTHEGGAFGVNQVAQLALLDDDDGTLSPPAVEHLVEGARHRWPPPALVCVEDTHLASGGPPWPLDRLRAVADVGVPVHLDGARLVNAAVATGTNVAERAAPATTVTSCLSKALGAPVGSVLAHAHPRPPKECAALLGGKGANLAEMTSVLELPVPPGFTITTDACRAFLADGWPDGLDAEVAALDRRFDADALTALARATPTTTDEDATT